MATRAKNVSATSPELLLNLKTILQKCSPEGPLPKLPPIVLDKMATRAKDKKNLQTSHPELPAL